MNKPLSIAALLTVALLLVGCGGAEDPSLGDEAETPSDARRVLDSGAAVESRGAEEPGLSIAVDEDDGEIVQEITVVNASTLKALRRQAAAQRKVLVVDCWATWCGSCVAMFPQLHEAMKDRGEGVVLVSLSFDEGEELTRQAEAFLTKQDAWADAYQAAPGSDARDAIAKALGGTWDGGALPAVFVYKPDGAVAYEMLETRGEVKDWVAGIAAAVDGALQDAEASSGQ